MELHSYIEVLAAEGPALAAAARDAGLDAEVPTCPRWTVRHLVAHVGYVHRWATRHVAGALREMCENPDEDEIHSRRPPDGEIFEWFEDGHAALVDALKAAPEDLECWTFMAAPSPLVFWARRQAHETAVHRVDAQLAAGTSPARFVADFAVDGIDEVLAGFVPRRRLGPEDPRDWAFHVKVDEGPECWTVSFGPERPATTRGPGVAACTVAGPASDVYLALWNRVEPLRLRVEGDEGALARWASFMHVRW